MRRWLSVLVFALLVAPIAAQEPTSTPTAAPETPTQFFTRYITALPTLKKIEDLSPFWSAKLLAQVSTMPTILDELKAGYARMTGIKVTRETVSDTGATLTLEAMFEGQKKTATMYLTKDNGSWKLFA